MMNESSELTKYTARITVFETYDFLVNPEPLERGS